MSMILVLTRKWCYEIFLAFHKVRQPSEKPATPAADATGNNFRRCLKRNHATAVR
jgi:hypothetical protein